MPRHLKNLSEQYSTEEFYQELLTREATFHKACSTLYNKDKLERKRKSFDNQHETEGLSDDSNEDEGTPVKRQNRGTKSSRLVCFLCELEDDKKNLHLVETFSRNTNIKTMAVELADHTLLAKLSEGDLIATEGRYHYHCMTELKNRHRSKCRSKSKGQCDEKFIGGG